MFVPAFFVHFYYLVKVFKFGAFFGHGRALGRMSPSCTVTSSKDINIRVKLRKQRIVGDYNRRFEKKLLVMPDRCVAFGCSNKADPENGIGLHKIPFFGDDREECCRRRKKWIDFVLCRRAHWKPTKHSN